MVETLQKGLEAVADSVSIVLVDTSHAGNIGAVARAMKNMGLKHLRLINPNNFPSDEATRRASGAADILEQAQCFSSLEDAVADLNAVYGASARIRSFPWPVMNPRDASESILGLINQSDAQTKEEGDFPRIGLVFGRESSGLTNSELQLCTAHLHIPANPEYSSLNLAMAVQVMCYELRMAVLLSDEHSENVAPVTGADSQDWDAPLSSMGEQEGLLQHLERVMIKIEYFDPNNPGMLMPRLRRLFQRRSMDKMEVNILRGILKNIEKRIEG